MKNKSILFLAFCFIVKRNLTIYALFCYVNIQIDDCIVTIFYQNILNTIHLPFRCEIIILTHAFNTRAIRTPYYILFVQYQGYLLIKINFYSVCLELTIQIPQTVLFGRLIFVLLSSSFVLTLCFQRNGNLDCYSIMNIYAYHTET